MELEIGDILLLKKAHACGERRWSVTRVGADIKLRCQGCGHLILLPRNKLMKQITCKQAQEKE